MPNPFRLISEMQTPKANNIIVCGILVLEEKRAAAKIIIKNIGIKYSKVTRPPWFKAVLAGAATGNIRLFVFTLVES